MSVEPIGRGASRPLSFDHLRRLSDDTGLLEHALGRVPRRREGYTTDDNARALWLATEWLSQRDAAGLSGADVRLLSELAGIYLAFLLWNQEEDGWWHNNVAYDRTWEPEVRSHDCQGRAVWACADAWIRLPAKERVTAYFILQRALPTLDHLASLRGRAYALAACAHLLEAGGAGAIELPAAWAEPLRRHVMRLERELLDAFRREAGAGWNWFEPVMTYGNGLLPWALLRAHRVTRNPEALETGLRSLLFLKRIMTAPEGWLRPVGNMSWATRDSRSRWDQQPLELFKLALALDEAVYALRRLDGADADAGLCVVAIRQTGAAGGSAEARPDGGTAQDVPSPPSFVWPGRRRDGADVRPFPAVLADLSEAKRRCLSWFEGDNDLGAPMADPWDGSCCDGLQPDGPNRNCGAEATISYLMTRALCQREEPAPPDG